MAGFMRKPQMINDPNAAPAPLRADDVDLQAQEGDFIIGYPAMQQQGPRVRSLVEQAMLKAKDKGVKTKGYKRGDSVDILAHNGEMHIPQEYIPYIERGYATLKKLNAPSKHDEGDVVSGRTISDADMGGKTFSDRETINRKDIPISDASYEYDLKELLKPKPKMVVPHPEHGSAVFAGNNIKGQMAWEKADSIMKKIFKSSSFDNKPKKANIMLYREAMNNLKTAVENGIDHTADFSSDKLVNKQFLFNIAKTTETAHLLNKANYVSTGEWLYPSFNVSKRGIKVNYPNGTPGLTGKGKQAQSQFDNTERTLKYEFDESFDKKDNWHKRDGMMYEAKHNIRDSQINSSGGTGYDGNNHTAKFNKDYNRVFNYLKQPQIEGFQSNIYDDDGVPAIGFGHRLTTKKDIEKYKNGITEEEAEDLLAKDIMEAEKNIRVVYNKFIKDEGYTGDAAKPFKGLDVDRRAILVEMAFNMGASKIAPENPKGFPKLFKALAHKDYQTMTEEYHRKGVSEERNTEFLETFINPLLGKFNLKKGLTR